MSLTRKSTRYRLTKDQLLGRPILWHIPIQQVVHPRRTEPAPTIGRQLGHDLALGGIPVLFLFRRWQRARPVTEQGRHMERDLGHADHVDRESGIEEAFRRQAEHGLVDVEVPDAGGDDHDGEAGTGQVPIDVMFVERVQDQVDAFQYVPLVRLRGH